MPNARKPTHTMVAIKPMPMTAIGQIWRYKPPPDPEGFACETTPSVFRKFQGGTGSFSICFDMPSEIL